MPSEVALHLPLLQQPSFALSTKKNTRGSRRRSSVMLPSIGGVGGQVGINSQEKLEEIKPSLQDAISQSKMRHSPQGIPVRYFLPGFTPRNTRTVENAGLTTIAQNMSRCSASIATIRWRLAIRLVLDRKYLDDLNTKDEKPYVIFMRDRKTITFPAVSIPQFIMLNAKNSLVISMSVQGILSLPLVQRTKRHLDILDEILKRYNMIGKFTREFRTLLYDVCTLEIHCANKNIVLPGSTAHFQYIIMSGIAKSQTMPHVKRLAALYPPNTKARHHHEEFGESKIPISVSFLSPGDTFGEFTTIKESEFRAPNIVITSVSQLHLLSFEKEAIRRITNDLENKFSEKQTWLQNLPGFRTLPRYTIDCIARTGVIKKFSAKTCIIRSNDPETNNYIYMCLFPTNTVMGGDATAYKLSTFIKRPSAKATFFRPRYTLFPYDPERLVAPSEGMEFTHSRLEDVVFDLVPLGPLPLKCIFPHGLDMKGHDREKKRKVIREALESSGFDKHTVIVGQNFTATGSSPGSFDYDGGFTGGGSCECFVIARKDLINIVGGISKLEVILAEMPPMPDFNERELQQKHLASKGWAPS